MKLWDVRHRADMGSQRLAHPVGIVTISNSDCVKPGKAIQRAHKIVRRFKFAILVPIVDRVEFYLWRHWRQCIRGGK
jgi:hypothetical protein